MSGPLADWPERVMIRLITLYQTRVALFGRRLTDGDIVNSTMLAPLVSRTFAPGPVAPMSINAIAESMRLPYETARRHAAALVADGLCVRTTDGITLAAGFLDTADFAAYTRQLVIELGALLGNMRAMDVALPAAAGQAEPDPHAIEAAALDLSLVGLEYWTAAYALPIDMMTFAAIAIENCYPFTADRAASRRYGAWDTPPPEALKRPVTARAIATMLGEPASTIVRSTRRLRAAGRLTATPRGLVIAGEANDALLFAPRRRMIEYYRLRLSRLARAGVDLEAIAADDLARRGRIDRDLHDDPFLMLPAPA